MHILDVAQNSISAGAKNIYVGIDEDTARDTLSITINDDGCGMTPEFLEKVTDPFTTTRKTRRVGLGLPLFKAAAEMTGGSFEIQSAVGAGTKLTAVFGLSHIDRMPLGDIATTVMQLVMAAPETDFVYRRSKDGEAFELSTAEVRRIMEGIPIDAPEVLEFIHSFIQENENELTGGIAI